MSIRVPKNLTEMIRQETEDVSRLLKLGLKGHGEHIEVIPEDHDHNSRLVCLAYTVVPYEGRMMPLDSGCEFRVGKYGRDKLNLWIKDWELLLVWKDQPVVADPEPGQDSEPDADPEPEPNPEIKPRGRRAKPAEEE